MFSKPNPPHGGYLYEVLEIRKAGENGSRAHVRILLAKADIQGVPQEPFVTRWLSRDFSDIPTAEREAPECIRAMIDDGTLKIDK